MALSAADAALLVGAGMLAATVGTAGGITSLISYPALLAVGIAPLAASITNLLAIVPCLPGSALASRPELRDSAPWLARWAPLAMVGSATGSALLLSTSAGVFDRIVPFLLVLAALSLFVQPRVSAWRERRGATHNGMLLGGGLAAASLYNGYFGAGSGVMTLALLLVMVDARVARANALKNIVVGMGAVVSAIILFAFAHLDWAPTGSLALGMFAGSAIGPSLARRIPGSVLRWGAALTGIGLALWLWLWIAPG